MDSYDVKPQTPPPLPPQVIAYATPMPYRDEGAWREGVNLVIRKSSSLPCRCVKCNMDVTDGWRWRKTLYWHHPALALMILFPGLLIYAIVALIVRQKAEVEASLCEAHRATRNKWLAATWAVALLSVACIFGGIMYAAGVKRGEGVGLAIILIGIVLIIAAVVVGGFARVLTPTKITSDFAYLKGAGAEFLATFPSTSPHG